MVSIVFLEIEHVKAGGDKEKYLELHHNKPVKMSVKVRVPVKEFPKVSTVLLLKKIAIR